MAKRRRKAEPGVVCNACHVRLTQEQVPIHDATPEHQALATPFIANLRIDTAIAKVVPGFRTVCEGFSIGRPFIDW